MTTPHRLALLGAIVYVATLLAVPLLNPSLDHRRLHPEDYAGANGGFLVNAGYIAIGVAAVALAIVALRAGGWLGRIAASCFLVAALTCAANAIDPTLGTRRSPVELGVFGLVFGPLALSARLRHRVAFALALVLAVAFVALIAWPEDGGGLVNRAFDVLIGVWCIVVAASDRRGAG